MNDKFIWRDGDILITAKLQKARVYIQPGQQPPLGTWVEEGPRGGHYYESEDIPRGAHQTFREDPQETAEWAREHAVPKPDVEGERGVPSFGHFKGDVNALFAWASGEESSYEQLQEFFAGVWQTGSADITVTDVSVKEDSIEVRMVLDDPETGKRIGQMDRTFHKESGSVHHDVFILDAAARGRGIALAINRQAEERYYAMGFEYVELAADIDIGKYAWAQQGYNFSDEYERANAWESLIRFKWENMSLDDEIDDTIGVIHSAYLAEIDNRQASGELSAEEAWEERKTAAADRDERIEELREEHEGEPSNDFTLAMQSRFEGSDAWELAAVDDGELYDAGGYMDMPLGKAFMISDYMAEWSAYKNLNPDSTGARVGAIYYDKKKDRIKGQKKQQVAAMLKAEGGRFPVELPKGSALREGVTDEGAHDIDEDTDQEWRDALKEMKFEEKALKKARTYLKPGQEPPGGQQVEEGPRGGRYYESEGRGAAEEKPGARAVLPGKDAYWDILELNDRYKDAGTKFAFEMGHEGPNAWKSSEVRAALKGHLASEIAYGTRMDVEIVNEFIASWASSSSDDSAYSLSMQIAVSKMFGSKPTAFIQEAWSAVADRHEEARKIAESQFESWKRPAEKALNEGRATQEEYDFTLERAQAKLESDYERADEQYGQGLLDDAARILQYVYRSTQEWLRVRGIEKVTLGRGQSWGHKEAPKDIKREASVQGIQERYQDWDEIRKKAKELIEKQSNILERKMLALQEQEHLSAGKYQERADALFQEFDYNRARINRRASMMGEGQGMWIGEVEFEQNPLSSWSSDPGVAHQFSTMRLNDPDLDLAVTMWAEIPAKRIISTPFTGPGCLTEHEFLVAGGKIPVHFRAAEISHTGPATGAHPVDTVREHMNPWWQIGRDAERKDKYEARATKLFDQGKLAHDELKALNSQLASGNPAKMAAARKFINDLLYGQLAD